MRFFSVIALVMVFFSPGYAVSDGDDADIEAAIGRINAAESIEQVATAIGVQISGSFCPVKNDFVSEDNRINNDDKTRTSPAIALERSQGWKLHISAAYGQEMRVLKLAIPLLLRKKVAFKIARSEEAYRGLEKKPTQKGKLITIYPMGAEKSAQLAQELYTLFKSEGFTPDAFMPPPNEMVFKDSGAVSYRFGSYSDKVTPACSEAFGMSHTFIIQKALKGDYYPLILDNRDLRRVPFVKNPFPKEPLVNWVEGINEMLEKKLYIDAQIALCTGEGLGGIRKAPITEKELSIFFEKIKETKKIRFLGTLLPSFMFTVQREKHEILHNLVCAALFYLSRQKVDGDNVGSFMDSLNSYKKGVVYKMDNPPIQRKYNPFTTKEIPLKQLFEENTDFGNFDQFLKDNKVNETISYYYGKMKEHFDRNGWPDAEPIYY